MYEESSFLNFLSFYKWDCLAIFKLFIYLLFLVNVLIKSEAFYGFEVCNVVLKNI